MEVSFADFGSLLKFLRRRAQLTQAELGLAVGYSEAHISRLENNQRRPDLTAVAALFLPALGLEEDDELAARLLTLARADEPSRSEGATTLEEETIEVSGAIESIPPLPADWEPPRALTHLRQHLAHERRILLYGLPGAGKTTLAAALAAETARTSPVFWLTFTEGVTTSLESIVRQLALFTLTLGVETALPLLTRREPSVLPLPLAERLALLSRALSGQDCLLCFDRLNLVAGDTALLSALRHLAVTSRVRVLLTSREALSLSEFTPVPLKGLETEESMRLLARLGVSLPAAQMEQVALQTEGNPMLLRLLGAYLRHHEEDASNWLSNAERVPQAGESLFEATLESLSAPARRMVECLSLLPMPLNLSAQGLIARSEALIGGNERVWKAALAELQRRQLIEHPASARLHPLLRAYVYHTLESDPARQRSLHHHLAEFLAADPDEILQAASQYTLAHEFEHATDLLVDGVETLIDLAQTDLALPLLEKLLQQAERVSDRERARALLGLRGDLLRRANRLVEAEESYRQALELSGERAVRAHLIVRLAQTLLLRQQSAEVLSLCASAARGLPMKQYPLLRAQLAALECQAHLALSSFDRAAAAAKRALMLARRLPLPLSEAARLQAQVYLMLGTLAALHGDRRMARRHWESAAYNGRLAGLKSVEYRAYTNLGIVLYQEGNFAASLEHYQQALLGARDYADDVLAARVLSNMAVLHHLCGEFESALVEIEESYTLREKWQDQVGMANLNNTRASILLAQGRLAEAHTLTQEMVRQAEHLQSPRLLGSALDTLAQIQLAQKEVPAARASLERALHLPAVQEETSLHAELLRHLAFVQLAGGETEAAESTLAHLPADESPAACIEFWLISGWLAWRRKDQARAEESLARARDRMETSGCFLYRQSLQRLKRALQEESMEAHWALV